MMNTRLDKPARFTRAFRETEEIIPLPVDVRTQDMRSIYNEKLKKLILGQKHSSKPNSRSASRPSTAPKRSRPSTGKDVPVGKGVSQPGSKPSRPPTSGLTFQDSIETSMSMLSIGQILDEFHSSVTSQIGEPQSPIGSPENPENSNTKGRDNPILSPLRRPITPAAWKHPKLFCRYPNCKLQFKSAFDLFTHTRKSHTDERNFQQSVVPQRSSVSYRLAQGEIDPRRRASPRSNCSGLLPEVPKAKLPSPDKYGLVWPVEVMQQQSKFQQENELANFRAHSAKLRDYNATITEEQHSSWVLNKSPIKGRSRRQH
jgi:hypothetical protein